jgi:N-acetylmuramoyl-L-alanine amidase
VEKSFCRRCSLSEKCAQVIHRGVVSAAADTNAAVCDRGVKQSFAYVLFGSRVTAVLVEVGFVSHPKEVRLLMSQQYQERLARGLCGGIVSALERVA